MNLPSKTTILRAIMAMSSIGVLALTPQKASADYCRIIWESGMSSCGFVTFEQCKAMVSGRTGSCVPSSFPAKAAAHHPIVVYSNAEMMACQTMKLDCMIGGASSAFAYLPKNGAAKKMK